MAGRIDHSTVSFTTNYSIRCFHLGDYIYFSYSRGAIFHTVFAGYITQSTGRTQIRNRIARSMLQYIIGYSNQCIFFTVHDTVLADHSQTVNIRVYNECNIRFSTFHQVHDVTQVFFKWFGVMLEVSGRFTIEFLYMFHTQTFQEFRKDNTSYRVYTVDSYTEIRFLDSFHIYQVESQYAVDMFLIISQVFAVRSQVVYIGIVEFLSLSNTKYFVAFFRIQEFSMFIE